MLPMTNFKEVSPGSSDSQYESSLVLPERLQKPDTAFPQLLYMYANCMARLTLSSQDQDSHWLEGTIDTSIPFNGDVALVELPIVDVVAGLIFYGQTVSGRYKDHPALHTQNGKKANFLKSAVCHLQVAHPDNGFDSISDKWSAINTQPYKGIILDKLATNPELVLQEATILGLAWAIKKPLAIKKTFEQKIPEICGIDTYYTSQKSTLELQQAVHQTMDVLLR
jgi:hypothetical protein